MQILALSGSLRSNSSTNAIIKQIAAFVSADIDFIIYNELATIPAFDDRETTPEAVKHFKALINKADGVLICTPEYAFGVPGALKNAIDWTVSSSEFVNKPVALITASSQGEKGHAALLNTLSALSTITPTENTLLISFIRAKLNEAGEIKDEATLVAVKNLLNHFLQSTSSS